MVREKPREHGLKNLIDGYVPKEKYKVVIVDDVFTTGASMSKIITALAKTKAKILAGYVVINRGDAFRFKIKIHDLLDVKKIIS